MSLESTAQSEMSLPSSALIRAAEWVMAALWAAAAWTWRSTSPRRRAPLDCPCMKCSRDSVCVPLACIWTARPDRFSPVYRHRLFSLAVAAAVYIVAAACSETLPEGRACPATCPNQSIPVVDTVIDGLSGMAVDTTITGYPLLGTEPQLLVAASGDSIDVRTIVRFDSVQYLFRPNPGDTLRPATHVYNAYLRLRFDTLSFRPRAANSGEPTLSVYDVDTAGSDTA